MNREVRFCTPPDVNSGLLSAEFTALGLAQFRPGPHRLIVPDVCCDLVWARGHLTLTGPMTRAVASSNVGKDVTLLRLDPLVAYRLFRMPLSCFTDRAEDVANIDPRLHIELEAMMRRGNLTYLVRPTHERVLQSVDARVVAAVEALRRGAKVATVAAMVGLSERQLERVFQDHTGLPPKTFARITRFRGAVKAAKTGASLADVAAAAGYADQAHFSRDSRALAGVSPRAILRRVGKVQDIVAGTM